MAKKRTSIRLDASLIDWIDERAEKLDMSRNEYLNVILKFHVTEEEMNGQSMEHVVMQVREEFEEKLDLIDSALNSE